MARVTTAVSVPPFEEALASRTIEFVRAGQRDEYLNAVSRLRSQGCRTFRIEAGESDVLAQQVAETIRRIALNCDCRLERPGAVRDASPDHTAVLIFESDAEKLSDRLIQFVNLPISIVAPITTHYFQRRSCFVITVPKAGTHMLFELLSAFRLKNGGGLESQPVPQHYHFLTPANSHTTASDFFRRLADYPRGGADHPFFVTPTLFLYRNPLDVAVSESYYYRDGSKTALAAYFGALPDAERLRLLLRDDPLIGSIRDRIRRFVPYVKMHNVIPLSFEELVGPRGGGSAAEQLKTIWSLQLKLHVPGSPAYYAAALFRTDTNTFRKGAINSHVEHFTEDCRKVVRALNLDFMDGLGYGLDDRYEPGYVPRYVDEFRRRPLRLAPLHQEQGQPADGPASEAPGLRPEEVLGYGGYYVAAVQGVFLAVPRTWPFPLEPRVAMGDPAMRASASLRDVLEQIQAQPRSDLEPTPVTVRGLTTADLFVDDPPPPVLAKADVNAFNIVLYNHRFYTLRQSAGRVDVQWDNTSDVPTFESLEDAEAWCQSAGRELNP